MKIYLVSTLDGYTYDEYDACVVTAKNEVSAIEIAQKECWNFSGTLSVEYIGNAVKNTKEGVVLSSFNAG